MAMIIPVNIATQLIPLPGTKVTKMMPTSANFSQDIKA
jgi:hypothetical protein